MPGGYELTDMDVLKLSFFLFLDPMILDGIVLKTSTPLLLIIIITTTITTMPGGYELTDMDVLKLQKMYGCDGACGGWAKSEDGGFPN